jgi:hypothetical protein
MQPTTEIDAREFGIHMRQGGWRLGLLVARNVEKKSTAHRPHVTNRDKNDKVSAREFSEVAGVDRNKVLRYLKAWNIAAEDGFVPPSSELSPGEEVDLNVDKLPEWTTYLRQTLPQPQRQPVSHTVGDWEAGESITKKKAAIVDSYPTVPELLTVVESEIEALMGWRYVLNKADLRRFKKVLIEALEEVENYDPEARKKAPHPVLGEV